MKECDNSTRKIHISNNFILSISLLTLFDTLFCEWTYRPTLKIEAGDICKLKRVFES